MMDDADREHYATEAQTALSALGDNPARIFIERGIKGGQSGATDPISQYLNMTIPGPRGAHWSTERESIKLRQYGQTAVWVESPASVEAFRQHYRAGLHPELVDTVRYPW